VAFLPSVARFHPWVIFAAHIQIACANGGESQADTLWGYDIPLDEACYIESIKLEVDLGLQGPAEHDELAVRAHCAEVTDERHKLQAWQQQVGGDEDEVGPLPCRDGQGILAPLHVVDDMHLRPADEDGAQGDPIEVGG